MIYKYEKHFKRGLFFFFPLILYIGPTSQSNRPISRLPGVCEHQLMTQCSSEKAHFTRVNILNKSRALSGLMHNATIVYRLISRGNELTLHRCCCLHSPRKTFAPGPAYLVISPSIIRSIDKMFSPVSPS